MGYAVHTPSPSGRGLGRGEAASNKSTSLVQPHKHLHKLYSNKKQWVTPYALPLPQGEGWGEGE